MKSKINENSGLVKAAEQMGKNEKIQQEANNLINQYISGNTNPGLGTKNLLNDIYYLRGANGARVFYRIVNEVMEILAKADKSNEAKVIKILINLYK